LANVRKSLDESYFNAIELLFNCPGKVLVTGAGKSGLIAQKIVATIISTGTQASSLHPGDALHVNLGIVSEGDVFLALSKSGETEELVSILPYARSLGSSNHFNHRLSGLNSRSDVVIHTRVEAEACPLNLAPTSSTTAALVFGDALAMCLMKMRGFQPENFSRFHLGGQLGKRLLMTVGDIMRKGNQNPVVNVNDTFPNMLSMITRKLSGAVTVVANDGQLLGLVADFDIRKVLEKGGDLFALSISEIMNGSPTSIRSDAKAIEGLQLMENREHPFLVLPVLEQSGKKVVGMVHFHDLVAQGS